MSICLIIDWYKVGIVGAEPKCSVSLLGLLTLDIFLLISFTFTKSIIQHKFYIDIYIEIAQKISIFSWA